MGAFSSSKFSFRVNPYWLFVSPLLMMIVVLYAYPIFKVLLISFTDPNFGFQNYQRLFTNSSIHHMMLTTLKICTITTILSMLLGYFVAYAMIHVGKRHRLWILFFILVPFWVSVLARAFSWLMLLHSNGIINNLFLNFGFITEPLELVRNQMGVIIGMVHYLIPYAVLPLFANMQGIDKRLVTAARGLGAGPFKAFCQVFLPLTLPGIIGAGVLVFILTLGFFVTPTILGGGKTVMIAEYVSVQILQIMHWGVGAMLSVVLLASIAILFMVLTRFVKFRELFGAH
jgi:putative spermidine/putrescine transport system permease protein